MEKAYKRLVTSLTKYGSKLVSENFVSTSTFIEASGVLKSAPEKPKQTRQRKSARQKKRIVGEPTGPLETVVSSPSKSKDIALTTFRDITKLEAAKEIGNSDLQPLPGENSIGDEDEDSTEVCDATSVGAADEDFVSNDTEHKEENGLKNLPKRRSAGRKRQFSPSLEITKDGKTASVKESSSVKKRGRPRLYDDSEPREFPCSECNFVATKRSKLSTHRLRVHEAAPVPCDLCPKTFLSKRYMLRHRASHTEPQHCCDVCGKMYKIKKAMLEHRKTHDAAYEKPKVTCELCCKTFCNRYILECHIRDIHMGQKKSYLCATCGKSFTTRHSLTEHTNAHTGVKPHVCEVCGKSFSYESALRDHRFTHEEAKHFWCKHCQKGFSQRSGLKMHMRIHRQNKMFVCGECGRGFTQKQALQRHERVHKGEKPFVCKHCGRLFTDASIIRRHLILVHKINKDAKAWREDIVCTVKPQNDYQVQKINDEEEREVERAKNELFVKAVGGTQPPVNTKGPSRAFCRTYPRRVALLDDLGNVIAPPEIPQRPLADKLKVEKEVSRKENDPVSISVQSNQIILAPDTANADMRVDAHVLNQSYVETAQWETMADQIVARENSSGNSNGLNPVTPTNQIEHTVLEKPIQHTQEHTVVQDNFHKLVKYEMQPGVVTVPTAGIVVGLGDTGIPQSNISDPTRAAVATSSNFLQQQQQHHQEHQQPQKPQQPQLGEPIASSSPISFTASTTPVVTQAGFDNLNQQAGHTSNVLTPGHIQYFEGRTPGTKNIATWSSMFYYSQLASQFGMNINPEYPYGSGIVTSSSSPLTGVQICGQPSPPLHQSSGSAATTFILQAQSLSELEQIVGMKGGQDSQHGTVLHLDSCDDQHQPEQQAAELAISLHQGDTADIQGRHLSSVPVADDLVLLQHNLQHHQQHHHSQQQQPGNSPAILISQRPSRHQQHQLEHQEVDLVEQLATAQNIPADQQSMLVRSLNGVTVSGHNSPSIQMPSADDSLAVLKDDLS